VKSHYKIRKKIVIGTAAVHGELLSKDPERRKHG